MERTVSSITIEEATEIAAEWLRRPGPTDSIDTTISSWLARLDHGSFYWDRHNTADLERLRSTVLDAAINVPGVEGEWELARQRAVASIIARQLFEVPDDSDGRH